MLKAIALDDEEPALEVIDALCRQTDLVDLQAIFTRTIDAEAYLDEFAVDLLFLDINMPAQLGTDFYRLIARGRHGESRRVIFTTAHSEYAVESYALNAVDYLLKPFTLERFLQAVQKAYDQQTRQLSGPGQPFITFRVDYGMVKVMPADILFVEGLDNYLKIHLTNARPLVVRLTMKAMLDKLPGRGFLRVHRSYIIALDKVNSVRNKLICIGEEEIPLSATYETAFYTHFPP